MHTTRAAQPDVNRAGQDQADTHIGRSRHWRRRALGVAGTFAATLAVTGLSGVARAELVPCDPIDCPTGPVYAPEQVAVGVDHDLDDAADEAEARQQPRAPTTTPTMSFGCGPFKGRGDNGSTP